MLDLIKKQTRQAMEELLKAAHPAEGSIVVVGCSSSEILGERIGSHSSIEVAQAVWDGMMPVIEENHLYLAAQCCEHLNRAIIIEREAAVKYGYEEVNVVPQMKAGGSFATTCYSRFGCPVAVEEIKASCGMDIGGTLIGMHLKHVAVPVRLSLKKIGEATLICARTRAKFIGGERAHYNENLL